MKQEERRTHGRCLLLWDFGGKARKITLARHRRRRKENKTDH